MSAVLGLLACPVSAQQEPSEPSASSPQIGTQVSQLLSSQGRILVGSGPNTMLVVDYPGNIERIAEFLKLVDVPAPQVAIEARVVEVKLQGEHALGVNWTLLAENQGAELGPIRLFSPAASNSGPITQSLPFKPTFYPPLGTSGQETPFSVTIFNDNLSLVLQALANSLKTDILSAPRITTVNNQKAEIKVIRRLPWAEPAVTTTGSGATATIQVTWTINFEEVGITLTVTPTINDDGMISMTLNPQVSEKVSDFSLTLVTGGTPSTVTYTVPVVDRREASTKVIIGNRQTLILGGLIKNNQVYGASKVPGIGDLPVVGGLFRSKKDTTDKSELLIFVSPTIITPEELVRHARQERFGIGRPFVLEREGQARSMDKLAREERAQRRATRRQEHTEGALLRSRVRALQDRQQSLSEERQALEASTRAEEQRLLAMQAQARLFLQPMKQGQERPTPSQSALPR